MFFNKIIDRVQLWVVNFNPKIKFLFFLGGVVATVVIILLAIGHFSFKKSELYFKCDLAIILCLILLLNVFYLILTQGQSFNHHIKSRISNKYRTQNSVEYVDLVAIYTLGQGYAAILKNGESVIWSKTLNQSLNELPSEEYFLINRSDIVNRSIIEGYQATESRRLKLILKKPLNNQKDFIVSQRKVVEFKNWYRNEPIP